MSKYFKEYDKRKKLFGIKIEGKTGWYVAPIFYEMGLSEIEHEVDYTWFKKDGKYGYYNIAKKCIEIPAEYGFPFYFNDKGYTVTWKDYKAGVIDRKGEIAIPFVYDEIETRFERVLIPDDEQSAALKAILNFGPQYRDVFRGYACFTNEGEEHAFDPDCRPDEFQDWEQDRLNCEPKYRNPEVESMTFEELEELIVEEYIRLIEMGYGGRNQWTLCSKEFTDKLKEQEKKVNSLLQDRRIKMDKTWEHNVENAKRIGRTNQLLMRAVYKAINLGRDTAVSLEWMMENESNDDSYEVAVYVYPVWQNSKSDLRYEPMYSSPSSEQDRLDDEEFYVFHTHIWNIIAAMGGSANIDGIGTCFDASSCSFDPEDWEETDLIGDDGQSWDEYLHFPAYQDVYFTKPFHFLCERFDFSYEDLCNINDFRACVRVSINTKEQDETVE